MKPDAYQRIKRRDAHRLQTVAAGTATVVFRTCCDVVLQMLPRDKAEQVIATMELKTKLALDEVLR